jgi:hypothetical protein
MPVLAQYSPPPGYHAPPGYPLSWAAVVCRRSPRAAARCGTRCGRRRLGFALYPGTPDGASLSERRSAASAAAHVPRLLERVAAPSASISSALRIDLSRARCQTSILPKVIEWLYQSIRCSNLPPTRSYRRGPERSRPVTLFREYRPKPGSWAKRWRPLSAIEGIERMAKDCRVAPLP